jgi:subtilisin-like proprotein convertase family protein
VSPIADNIRLAIDYAVERGRGGKGCVVLFAAGNGNESVDNDGYASYPKVLAVAASNDRSRRSVYSDFGRAVWLSFPSNDFGWPQEGRPEPLTTGIWTTDRTGQAGYNPNPETGAVEGDAGLKYTNRFGGTSSACPGAAGVAALVLARNPELSWQEVREILRRACERIDPQGGQYDAQGHSPFYGWGRVNAATAVTLAAPQPVANGIVVERQANVPIRDHQTARVTLDVAEPAPLAALTVRVELEHSFIGDLVLRLHPPAATGVAPVVLHDRKGGNTRNLAKDYTAADVPALGALVGKSPQGTWELEVRDEAAVDEGALQRLRLTLRLEQ